ncbi:MAG: hypothetical protein JW783_02795 [Bacteroidales bacterium]|nr:hypothetical protein [Bacteroidales bacterium]MBN2748994.1 hypothetical protein [Bacteroidales bacterium]
MKKLLLFIVAITVIAPLAGVSQDKSTIRAAELSYKAAERSYKNGEYNDAAKGYEIVVSSIPVNVQSRKLLEMKMESNIKLIDIYFSKSVNLDKACEQTTSYMENVRRVKNGGVLKSKDLLRYLELQQDFEKHLTTCANREKIDSEKKSFEKTFDEEFKED